MTLKGNGRVLAGVLGCWALYLFLSFSSWREPIMGDEVRYALFVKGLIHPEILQFFGTVQPGFGLWHPPLYAHVLALLEKFFVFNALTARIVSLFSFLIALIFIYLIARQLYKNDPKKTAIGLLACFLFSVNPLAVRGSLLIDMDGTVLNAAILIFAYLLLVTRTKSQAFWPGFFGYFICAAGLVLCFWIKLATPILFVGSLIAYFCLTRDFDKARRMSVVAAGGLVLFLLSWFFYAQVRQISFWSLWDVPFGIIRGFFEKAKDAKDPMFFIRNFWALMVWCSPSFIALGLISFGKALWRHRQRPDQESLLSLEPFAFYGAVVFAAYFFIGGVTHSFPKYHFAILPVFVIVISGFILRNISFDRRLIIETACVMAGLVLFNHIANAGDPLYTINYALKEDAVLRGGTGARVLLLKELVQMGIIFMTIVIAYLFFRVLKRPGAWMLSLVASTIACNLALGIVQIRAPYNTVYCYGAEKVVAAADFVRSHTRVSDKICAPLEIAWLANENLSSYLTEANLRNKDAFLAMLRRGDRACVAYGITGNTVQQYKMIFNRAQVRSVLKAGYNGIEIGSYHIWLRK